MSCLFLQNELRRWTLSPGTARQGRCSVHVGVRECQLRTLFFLCSELDGCIRILPRDSRFRTRADRVEVALEFVPVFLPVDSQFLQEWTPICGMPVELNNAEGMRAHCQCGNLCVRQHGDAYFAVMRLRRELTFVERGHTTCIMRHCQIGIGFIDHCFNFAKHREGTGEVALHK